MKRLVSLLLALSIVFSSTIISFAEETETKTDEQKNSIAMLNYISVTAEEIMNSDKGKLTMEEKYSSIINNTMPDMVDERTEDELLDLLDILEEYRAIDVKRERATHIFEQSKAKAMQQAVPNPVSVLNVVKSKDLFSLATSIVYLAVDSVSSYENYCSEVDNEFMTTGWELDDRASKNLHTLRSDSFAYMIDIVRDYNISGYDTLSENDITEFVTWENKTNVEQRLHFFIENQDKYKNFGKYWIILAKTYFEHGDYAESINAISEYEKLDIKLFRYDHDYAEILPFGISAAKEVYTGKEYEDKVNEYLSALDSNTDNPDISLHYFSAQTYINLYEETGNTEYLESAYKLVLNNVNYIVENQINANSEYLAPLNIQKKKDMPSSMTDAQKTELEEYNKQLKANRKTELAPVDEEFYLNLELLYDLMGELKISDSKKTKVNNILYVDNNNDGETDPIFLLSPLDCHFTGKVYTVDDAIDFDGEEVTVPANLVGEDYSLVMTITEPDNTLEISDWTVDEIERDTEGDISTFAVTFTNKEVKKYKWTTDSIINIELTPTSRVETDIISEKFEGYSKVKVPKLEKTLIVDIRKVEE